MNHTLSGCDQPPRRRNRSRLSSSRCLRRKAVMLRKGNVLLVGALGGSMAFAQTIVHQPVNPNGVTPVHTALDHISILSLPEKIARVATGSEAMQVEWH